MSTDTWRLILDGPRDGARNMAADEALLEETAAGRSPPTLRLYAWDPPTLSLGFAQKAADADRRALRRLGWGLVRRPTGGRAILHTDELTYAIAGPENHPLLRGGVLESYRRLSLGLLAGLKLLGVAARADSGGRSHRAGNPVCFEVSSKYEISVDWKKLVGSAQARRLGGVLQHGALPLRGDLSRILQVLSDPDSTAERIRRRAVTLADLLGREVPWAEAAQAVARGFAETFGIHMQRGELTEKEIARADELARGKYGSEKWTGRA